MAIMYPASLPETAEISYAERIIYSALKKNLSDKYSIYHSFQWTEDKNIPRELDFIVVNPDKGFIVLEIKGGTISIESDTWYTNNEKGKYKIKNPFSQARNGMYFLLDHFRHVSKENFSGMANYAVCFPQTSYDASYIHPQMNKNNVLFNQHIDTIAEWIEELFVFPSYKANQFSSSHIPIFCNMLKPTLHMHLSIRAAMETQKEEISRLDFFQDYLLDILEDKNRAAFQGTAGTGKTWIAIKKAMRLAREGKKCLFLCYNKYLRQQIAEIIDSIQGDTEKNKPHIYTFHGYANHLLREYLFFLTRQDDKQETIFLEISRRLYPDRKIDKPYDLIGLLSGQESIAEPWEIIKEYQELDSRLYKVLESLLEENEEGYFDFNTPMALLTILDDPSYQAEKYDAIIIDEAQDFKKTWCDCLLKLMQSKRNRIVYIFYDDNQNIFAKKGQLPVIELINNYNVNPYLYKLRKNIRNTQAIHDYAISRTDLGKTAESIDIRGLEPKVIYVKTEREAREETGRLLTELIEQEKIANKNIIVLTDTSVKDSAFREEKQVGPFKLTESGKGDSGKYVRLRSVRRFKGLESDAVILVLHPETKKLEKRNELLYVAITRARFLLYIIEIEE
ncbi:NERD domain-containing protein [Spirochaetia bacterium 38H-sp]|uniref:DNA 3'-5' helicase II n=1 Tax=Rarispira pelagica TaxID=3141764 RepID=A0ABU9UCD3_9SPIR